MFFFKKTLLFSKRFIIILLCRFLPHITGDANVHVRAAAERQAINTTVQGNKSYFFKDE